MLTITMSQIKSLGFDFEAAVADYIAQKKAHLLTEGEPAPVPPHPLVADAVKRVAAPVVMIKDKLSPKTEPDDFEAAYQIVDDSPPPPTVEQRREALASKARVEAEELYLKIVPRLKARQLSFQIADANAAKAAGTATDVHEAVLARAVEQNSKMEAIQRHLAEVESQIHDLPDDMIDVWKWPPFPA